MKLIIRICNASFSKHQLRPTTQFDLHNFILGYFTPKSVIDARKDGEIRPDALMKSMRSIGFSDSKAEVEEIIAALRRTPFQNDEIIDGDCLSNRNALEELGISFSAFLQANLDRSIVFSEDGLEKIFAYLDQSSKRWIGKREL